MDSSDVLVCTLHRLKQQLLTNTLSDVKLYRHMELFECFEGSLHVFFFFLSLSEECVRRLIYVSSTVCTRPSVG